MRSDRGAVLPAALALLLLVSVVFAQGLSGLERSLTPSVDRGLGAREALIGAVRVAAHQMELAGARRCAQWPEEARVPVLLNGHTAEIMCRDLGTRTVLQAVVGTRRVQAEVVDTPAGLRLRHWRPPEAAEVGP